MLFCAILNVIIIKGAKLMTQYHNIPPVYDKNSRILTIRLVSVREVTGGTVFLRTPSEPFLEGDVGGS